MSRTGLKMINIWSKYVTNEYTLIHESGNVRIA